MKKVELDAHYEFATRMSQLQDRARRRVVLGMGAVAAVAAIVVIVGFVLGRTYLAEPAIIAGVVFAIGSARNAVSIRQRTASPIGPVGGLPFAERRRAIRGLRRGQLDEDPLLHEVQLIEAGRMYDQRRNAWILPVLCLCTSTQAAVGRTMPVTLFFATFAAMFAVFSIQIVGRLRGAKRILAAG